MKKDTENSPLTAERIIEATSFANDILKERGYKTPRVAVCNFPPPPPSKQK
jgi:hypothetical protein